MTQTGVGNNEKRDRFNRQKIWQNMKTRCNNAKSPSFGRYGGRGIVVCDDWRNFENFKEWATANGYQENLTLDRVDVNGNYEPTNCRWITNAQQQLNKRTNHLITYNGKTQTIKEWSNELGMNYTTLSSRIMDYHWSVEKAITTPVKVYKRRKIHGVKNQ